MQPWGARDLETTEQQRLAGTERMAIQPKPDPVRGGGRRDLPGHGHSWRGWAKIIRPATVWSTRVTVTSTSLSIDFAAALDHDHRAVVEVADALARRPCRAG